MPKLCSLLLVFPLLVGAQSTPSVQATGTATVSVKPDQAQITIGVVTDGATAQEAADRNSTQTESVINALKGVLGSSGTIQTVSYSVNPRYLSGSQQPPVIAGYTASNTVQVISNDLSLIGRLIDTGNQAGANSVGGLSFSLQDPEPTRLQVLSQAAKQARAHADAIAGGLNAKTGAVLSAVEAATVLPVIVGGPTATAAPTPVETGVVRVTATVTLTVALVQ
jgi:uncharacterized protein